MFNRVAFYARTLLFFAKVAFVFTSRCHKNEINKALRLVHEYQNDANRSRVTKMRLRLVIDLLIFASTLAPIASQACSCLPVGTAQQEQAKSTLVFDGKVSAIEQRSSKLDKSSLTLAWEWVAVMFGAEPSSEPDIYYQRVGFVVKQTLKGDAYSNIQLTTGMGGGDCGYPFEFDKEYRVYARGTDAALTVNICSLTSSVATKPHAAK